MALEREPDRERDRVDIAIVGGGASGVLVATHLLSGPLPPCRVAIVEPDGELARGVAYGTPAAEHLLNVTAGRMSAFERDPAHFVRHLAASAAVAGSPDRLASTFAPRREYGRYLRRTLAAQPHRDALHHVRERVAAIERRDGYILRLASGAEVRAGAVVLAVGNAPRRLALANADADAALVNAWDHAAVGAIAPEADVCVFGAGLSMVDVVATLVRNGHRGRIRVVSRHGLMPRPHAAPGRHGDDVADLLGLGALGRTRALRRLVADAQAEGRPWQWVFDRLRPHGRTLWRAWDAAEQARFLRHAVRFWDVHRHRIAPSAHAMLERLLRSGQMEITAGRVLRVEAAADAFRVQCRLRGTDAIRTFGAQRLVDATGIETRLDRRADTLAEALLAGGLAVPGPHGLGIAGDGEGHVLGADGRPDPRLFVIGALRIGDLWETIAIPDLRVQAERIAAALRAQLEQRPAR